MPNQRRIIVGGEQRPNLDTVLVAQLIIRLGRQLAAEPSSPDAAHEGYPPDRTSDDEVSA